MAARPDERELGRFAHFEHVDFGVPEDDLATPLFDEGPGLTCDPTRRVSVRNRQVNAETSRLHLPIG